MPNLSKMSDTQVRVLEAIKRHGSRKFPLSRPRLSDLTKMSDRICRKSIEILRKNFDIRIETDPKGGYYIPRKGAKTSIGRRLFYHGLSILNTGRKLLGLTESATIDEIQGNLFKKQK